MSVFCEPVISTSQLQKRTMTVGRCFQYSLENIRRFKREIMSAFPDLL